MKSVVDPCKLRKLYSDDGLRIEEIASYFGCSVHNIKRVLSKHKIQRGKKKAYKAWNKGMTKDDSDVIAQVAASRIGAGNPMFGKKAWNSGKTKEGDASLATVSEKLTGRSISSETRDKQAKAKLGRCGEKANNWQGGRSYTNHLGYLMNRFTRDGQRWYEHRWVAWKYIINQRDFLPDEDVHHIDRDKLNNSPENLMVLSRSNHLALHSAIRETGLSTKEEQMNFLKENNMSFEVYNG